MAVEYLILPNLYQDSVSLMQLSAKLSNINGIEQASVIMGTPANLTRLVDAGFPAIEANPNDLVIIVKGNKNECEQAIHLAKQSLLSSPKQTIANKSTTKITSLSNAVEKNTALNLALISVPGEYAAAEAIKALNAGLNVMLFSDNVSLQEEKQIKTLAQQKDLLVMGPDCGTAIINGIPLGFANIVRAGNIGIIAASGTGLQEVTCNIDKLGEGISQAIGTGGHDLHQEIGGISMLYAMDLLEKDKKTEVIVLISKPPASNIAEKIKKRAMQINKPVVFHFLGQHSAKNQEDNLYYAKTLAHTAEVAVAVLRKQRIPPHIPSRMKNSPCSLKIEQQYIRGVFSGGTFCFEAQQILHRAGLRLFSNTPIAEGMKLKEANQSQQHTLLDLGDDFFTQGKPHPMIDPTLRNQRLLQEGLDPEVAVILFDLVLGYGANLIPTETLLPILQKIQQQNSPPYLIAHICGTPQDIQNKQLIQEQLQDIGVFVANNNAEATYFALEILQRRNTNE
ncbi:acyl-CoA synthetase FdrA [Avibacterium sp. 20-15]|uniref:acyl-CoA synthetase FdrA n=1 Tax=unclassified Avibacterium TaxID=2685287 RepID=UPI002025C865|nr:MULTISPECIES: acyl-CoA synthetase FdrA [unclassified Avibacterium]MCW9732953.1 acyl-CoA synthetase FdrA [Avibacterium sp. 20-15]URL05087.1 acyl-CoA synthetase FdrA [Avibacterium sp. 20-132]